MEAGDHGVIDHLARGEDGVVVRRDEVEVGGEPAGTMEAYQRLAQSRPRHHAFPSRR